MAHAVTLGHTFIKNGCQNIGHISLNMEAKYETLQISMYV